MPARSTPAGRSDYLRQLLAIRENPQIKSFARARAGDPDVAEDALQETYYAMAAMKHPERIEDLRKYFCTVLIRKAYGLRTQLGAAVVGESGELADACQRKLGGGALPPPFDETVRTNMLAENWLERLASQRAELTVQVPGRSPEPGRYREAIVRVAAQMLLDACTDEFTDDDLKRALRAAYPQWFAKRGVAAANIDQRFTRARADLKYLLQAIIRRDELYS